MSLNRLIFYSAMIGGWAAFVGWMLGEMILMQRSTDAGVLSVFLTTAIVGALIAGGLTLLGGVASGTLQGQLHRLLPGLGLGFVAGALGGLIGNLFYSLVEIYPVRILGWTVMGLAIGAVEGIYDQSKKKIINGLIGGAIGGFLGGLLFDPVAGIINRTMTSRAAAFVILGLCIGCFVGLAQVLLKEAWLTVEAGFRPGRQLVLNFPEVIMGTSEKAHLPFIAMGAKGVEPIHLRILRRDDGTFMLQDNGSRTGTFVNGKHVPGPVVLFNDDVIQLGVNLVRFRERTRHGAASDAVPLPPAGVTAAAPLKPAASPVPAAAVMASPPPMVKPAASQQVQARPKPPVQAVPAQAVAAKPAAPKPAPPKQAAPKPAAMPAPAAIPDAPVSAPTAPTGCPICGRVGAAIANSAKRRCASCGISY